MPIDSKFILRQKFRDIRAQIPVLYRQEAALHAAALFDTLPALKHSLHIACYLAFKDEFNSSPVIEAIWKAKKHCYLPVLTEDDGKSLYFVRYEYGDALRPNRYAILEPVNVSRVIAAEKLDMVVTPLLAFDRHGHRLGTGGGYYDRTFAFMHSTLEKKPSMIGLGYAAQEASQLPDDPWDIKLNGVVTEKEIILMK